MLTSKYSMLSFRDAKEIYFFRYCRDPSTLWGSVTMHKKFSLAKQGKFVFCTSLPLFLPVLGLFLPPSSQVH